MSTKQKLSLEVRLQAIDQATRPLKMVGQAGKQMEKQLAIAQRQMQSLNRAMADGSATDQYRRNLDQVAKRLEHLRSLGDKYQKTMALRDSMARTGAGALAVGGAALYGAARFGAPGMEFDTEMASVQALTRLEKQSEALAKLRQQARDLGASTSFTATQVAQGQGFLAMAGFNPEAITAAMPGMLALAKAGRTELAQTADIASNILTGFKLTADQTGRLGDILVGTFTRSNVDLHMLGETMKYVAPVAADLGVNIETAAAMAGKLGDAGIQGSMGGTALRAILSRLAAPPKMAADALEQLRIKTKDANGNLRNMPAIFNDIAKATAKMGDAERAGFLKSIAGEEAFSALSVLLNQSKTGELQKFIDTLRTATGEAQKNAATMADNVGGDIERIKSAWEGLGITFFDTQEGPLRALLGGVNDLLGRINQFTTENPKLASTLATVGSALGGIVAVGGALLLGVSAVLGPLAMAKITFGALAIGGKALLAPMLGVIGAVGLLAAGAWLVYENWDQIKAWFGGVWDYLKTKASETADWFAALPARFEQIGLNMMTGLSNGIRNAYGEVKNAVVGAADGAVSWVKDKLGINSPSRVFAELGGFTMQGLVQGVGQAENSTLKAIGEFSRRFATTAALGMAGAGIATAAPMPTTSAAPLMANAPRTMAGPSLVFSPTVYVDARGGADENAIRKAVDIALDAQRRHLEARRRSILGDVD